MPDQNYNTGDGLTRVDHDEPAEPRRKMTSEEAEAVMTLVRGGWLKLDLNVGD